MGAQAMEYFKPNKRGSLAAFLKCMPMKSTKMIRKCQLMIIDIYVQHMVMLHFCLHDFHNTVTI